MMKLNVTVEKQGEFEDVTWIVQCENYPACYGLAKTRKEAIERFSESLKTNLDVLYQIEDEDEDGNDA